MAIVAPRSCLCPRFALVFLFSVTVFCFTRKKRRDEAGSNA